MQIRAEEIVDNLDNLEYLKKFIEESNTATTALMNQTRVASDIYLAFTLRSTGNNLANEIDNMTTILKQALAAHAEALNKSAKASEKHAKSLTWATWALFGATLALVIVAIVSLITG